MHLDIVGFMRERYGRCRISSSVRRLMSKGPAPPQVEARGDQRRDTISTVAGRSPIRGQLPVPLATTIDGFLAVNTGRNDRFVQFLAGDRLVQNTMTAGGGFLDARRQGNTGPE